MTLDRKDIVIGLLVLVVSFQCLVASVMGGALVRLEQTSISVYDAGRIVALVERVHATNEMCVRVRINADQALTAYISPTPTTILEDEHGKVRNQNVGTGSGLRSVRVSSNGHGAED